MNFSRFFSVFIFLVSFNSFSAELKKINITGLDSISKGTVLNYLPIEVGDDVLDASLDFLKESLFKTNLFSEINVQFNDSTLFVLLKENPTIKFLDIKNFKEDKVLSEKIIDELKQNFELTNGKVFSKANFEKLLGNINFLYQDKAYFKSKIKVDTEIDQDNRIGIVIDIEENEQALISSFEISGTRYFPESDLIDLFSIGEPDIFIINYFTEKNHFSKKALNAGIESIKSKYLESGFLDIRIADTTVKYLDEKDSLSISILIDEGKQYRLKNINFRGELLKLKSSDLRSYIAVNDGDIFKRKDIVSGLNKIASLYHDLGYAFANVNSNLSTSKNSDLIEVNVDVDLDKRIFLNRIDITGNFTTQDDVIRRALLLNEGEVYSKEELTESIKRVKRLGFFSKVDYEIKRHKVDNDKVDIFIEVEETKTGEISVGLSHSNSTGASLTAGISQKNILGTGNTLKAAFSNSDAVQEASFYFLDPNFNSSGHSISYGFFDKSTDAANLDTSSYNLDETGVKFGYGVPTSINSNIFGEIKIASIDLTCGSSLLSDESSQCLSNADIDTNLTLTFSDDSLNDFYFASEGSKNILTSSLSLPVGDYKYYQILASHRSYHPVMRDKVFKASTRLNYASGYGGKELPFFKRFYEGGSSSVRGFDFNSLGAKYSSTGKPKGGELSVVSSLALISSLDFAGLDNENMRLGGFVDVGNLSEKTSNFDIADMRVSAGIQFSWLTPIGPIGVVYAQPLVKKSTDKTQSFAFELGATF